MFAVVRSGGKQYRVSPGDVFKVEKLDEELDSVIDLREVLMVSFDDDDDDNVIVGNPTVESATVTAEVIRHLRDRKVIIFKKKRRHNYRRKTGHRQHVTLLRVLKIAIEKGE
jgi:large subunit ribosomal protein L21